MPCTDRHMQGGTVPVAQLQRAAAYTAAYVRPCQSQDGCELACRSIAENLGRSDWKDLLTGKGSKDNRSGLTIYGTTKLFNIMLAREFARRLEVRHKHVALATILC